MLAATNCPDPGCISMKGRLLEPLILGQQTIPSGNAVLMDGYAMYYVES
jgi:hypothetical protein